MKQTCHLHYDHHYITSSEQRNERRTRWVMLFSFVIMLVEISAGYFTHSMALLADGWHMATDVFALGITVFAYQFARKHAANPLYSFGTGKVNALGGFASGVALVMVALIVAGQSLMRFTQPEVIHFNEAIIIATVGLVINLGSAWILRGEAHHHEPHHHAHDHNLSAAYLHVIADAFTSLLAIIALLCGKYYGWNWLDAVAGLIGAVFIGLGSTRLLRQTSDILLDRTPGNALEQAIQQAIHTHTDAEIIDLHVWQLATHHYAAILSLTTASPQPPAYYKALLSDIALLSHITVEVHLRETLEGK
jgi:cation diffusion facilitator family transporter